MMMMMNPSSTNRKKKCAVHIKRAVKDKRIRQVGLQTLRDSTRRDDW